MFTSSRYLGCNHFTSCIYLPKLFLFDSGICYEPVCTGRIDGHYPDTTHACRRSYQCKSGRLFAIDNCPYGQLFSGHSCAVQDFVTCELPQTTAIAYPFSGDRRCMGLSNGVYATPNTNCTRYLTCENQEVVEDSECGDGYKYDDSVKQCRPGSQVTSCSGTNDKLCASLANGYNHDPTSTNCRSYIKCHNQKFISREFCSSQAVFNGNLCIPQPLYECPFAVPEISPSRDMCNGKTNGFSSDPRRGCSGYVKCAQGKTVESLECSQSHYFDPDSRRCVLEKVLTKRKCQEPISSNECLQLEMGYYQDKTIESSCQKYFFCFNGNRSNFECANGKVFDGENCVRSNSYVCPSHSGNSCISKLNGYYKDESAGCRAYFYCSQGIKYRYLCKDDERFDGTTCVPRKSVDDCQNMNDCAGKSDGYYQNIETDCRKYFFCLKQEVVTTLTCRGSKVYNGHKCVSADEYTCPRFGDEDLQNCVPRTMCHKQCKANGFYADLDSGCRKYHFCIANNKSVLSCADGLLFNGEICVPEEQYTCPKYCTDVITDNNGNNACLE